MKTRTCRSLALLALGFLIVSPRDAAALDAVCELFVKACEARANAPAWQSTTELESGFKLEALKAKGQYYTRKDGGAWQTSPTNIDDAERMLVDQIRKGTIKLTSCKNEGIEKIDGVETAAISYNLEMPGAPSAKAKINIGKADGLPYALTSDAIKSSYRYKDLAPP